MQKFDLHMHTTYCDGENSPREMIEAAILCGHETVGISEHSHTPHDEWWCLSPSASEDYRKEMASLKEEYAEKVELLCGLEMDYFSDEDPDNYDYTIGSVHYIRVKDEGQELVEGTLRYEGYIYIPIDEDAKRLEESANEYFGGDLYSLIELYFETVSKVVMDKKADVIGHFDLVTKYNEDETRDEPFVDESNPRYIAAWQKAVDKILEDGKKQKTKDCIARLTKQPYPVFEINYGAVVKGYRTKPYLTDDIVKYIKEKGGAVIKSSDGHAIRHLGKNF